MKKIIAILISISSAVLYAQDDIYKEFQKIDSALEAGKYIETYPKLKLIEQKCNRKDTLYLHILSECLYVSRNLEYQYRMNEKYDTAIIYAKDALMYIEIGKSFYDKKLISEEYFWMQKNLLVSYFEIGEMDNAMKQRKILYKAYKSGKLPKDFYNIDQYYNFSYFKWKDKNIWGYEWYPDLPSDRFNSSFTKIVYYVYSTKPDGSDNEQIYRFHVLMFHHNPKNAKFDYILERQINQDDILISGSYYGYTYKEEIDYIKLKKDIIEILEKDIQPDSRRTMRIR